MKAGQKWAKDIGRKKTLQKRGYKVIIVWETDWKNDKQSVITNIIKEINNAAILVN